ncbi:MAG: hypothetical protein M1469_05340 [Bacteroidetes bacterium]|nr:hypothetical protein [Bacteroidota bacterium]
MEQYRIVLGLEVGRDFLRAAEVEHRNGEYFLSRIVERTLDSLKVDDLVQLISLLINEEAILSRTVSAAIDTTLLDKDTIDVDSDLQHEEIANFLKAETAFHNDFIKKEFRPAYEVVGMKPGAFKEIFYAAVDKELLESLKNACTRCGFELNFIDLDHSCSELTVNKLVRPSENYILITVKGEQIEGSFCKNGERAAYKYVNYSGEPFYFVTKISNDLESLVDDYAGKIYITGSSADTFLIDLLKKSTDTRFELLVPNQNMLQSPAVLLNPKLNPLPHYFSSVIGAALK